MTQPQRVMNDSGSGPLPGAWTPLTTSSYTRGSPTKAAASARREECALSIVWTVLVGFVVGVIAKFLHPGRENMGLIMTTLLGIVGSVVAGYVGQLLGFYQAGQGAGFIGSVLGALLLLIIYGFVRGRSRE
jgi:uncharacterized membrane protein YeaQ/YmgE (transglycosylase-associated protein family)